MADLELAKNRQRLFVPAQSSVEIRVDFQNAQEELIDGAARVVCLSCNRELISDPERRLLECPECGYELTPAEVGHLCDLYIDAINKTFGRVSSRPKGGFWWRFIRWLRRERPTHTALPS